MYALFKYNRQISKSHPFKICAIIEAFERGVVMTKIGLLTGEGWEIKEQEDERV